MVIIVAATVAGLLGLSRAKTGEDDVIIIDAPHFYAAVVCASGRVARAAPIIKYMAGWTEERVITYARSKGWSVTLK